MEWFMDVGEISRLVDGKAFPRVLVRGWEKSHGTEDLPLTLRLVAAGQRNRAIRKLIRKVGITIGFTGLILFLFGYTRVAPFALFLGSIVISVGVFTRFGEDPRFSTREATAENFRRKFFRVLHELGLTLPMMLSLSEGYVKTRAKNMLTNIAWECEQHKKQTDGMTPAEHDQRLGVLDDKFWKTFVLFVDFDLVPNKRQSFFDRAKALSAPLPLEPAL